jgi:HAMP domain-containing protein
MPSPSARTPEDPRWWDIFNPVSSIRAQAALVFGLLAAGFTLHYSNRAAEALASRIEADAGPLFETLAGSIRERIDRGMYERFHELQVAAAMPIFRDPTVPEATRRVALNLLHDTEEEYAWIGFANPEGRMVIGTHGLREGTDISGETWFDIAVHGGTHVGNVHEAPDLADKIARTGGGIPRVFDLAVPVTDINGKILGVLCASLRWSWVEEIQAQVVPESARRRLFGVTIYSPQGDILLDTGTDIWAAAPPPYPPVPVSARGQTSFRGYLHEEVEREAYLTGYALTRGFRNFRGLGLLVAVRQPDRRAFAEVGELRGDIRLIGFSATAFLVVAAWGFAGLLTQRLRAIESAAEYIRDGDQLALIPRPAGRGDLARMCRSLGRMVAKLRGAPDAPEKSSDK